MSKLVQGKFVILSIHDGTAYLPIGCITTNSLNETQEVNEGEPNKCDTTIPKSQGAYTYDISADAVMLASDDPTYSARAHYDKVRQIWKDSRADGSTIYWKMEGSNTDMFGEGFLTELSSEYPTDGNATFSVGISGIGETSATDLYVEA